MTPKIGIKASPQKVHKIRLQELKSFIYLKIYFSKILDMLLVFCLCLAVGMVAGNLISKRLGLKKCYEL